MRRFSFKPSITFKGRKLKGLSGFEGKPFHPPLTDVTVGAYVIAPILDVISFLLGGTELAGDLHRAATFVLVAGLVSAVPTVVTGLVDWTDTEKGTQARRTVNAHAWTMVFTNVLVLVSAVLHVSDVRGEPAGVRDLVLGILVLALVTVGGTIGGSLTYDYGFNVSNSTDHPVWHKSESDVFPGDKGGGGD